MPSRAFLSFSREFVACDQTTFVRSFANSGQYSGTSIERNRNIMIHNCQEDFLIREITGKSLSIRKYSKSEALAEDFESFLIQGLRPVIPITTKSE